MELASQMTEGPSRFLLYIDILGFKEMTLRDPRKVARVYAILDSLNAHNHPNFRTIVFSDTILIYNPDEVFDDHEREYLVWYLTEFAEDLQHRLVGQDIWFRAVLLSGDFEQYSLKNIECFYGDALIKAYESEKGVPIIGLLMSSACAKYNKYFKLKSFSESRSFVYLNRQIDYLYSFTKEFPSKMREAGDQAPDIAFVRYLADLYQLMRMHRTPAVRAKALATWDYYNRQYPELLSALVQHSFELSALGPPNAWSNNARAVAENIRRYKRIGAGTELSRTITRTKRVAAKARPRARQET